MLYSPTVSPGWDHRVIGDAVEWSEIHRDDAVKHPKIEDLLLRTASMMKYLWSQPELILILSGERYQLSGFCSLTIIVGVH